MKANKPKTKTPRNAMPTTTLTPLSSRKRRKRITARVSAAISIEEPLYLQALQKAKSHHDNNFSGFIRYLIKSDLAEQN
jgi:hypothetical protein